MRCLKYIDHSKQNTSLEQYVAPKWYLWILCVSTDDSISYFGSDASPVRPTASIDTCYMYAQWLVSEEIFTSEVQKLLEWPTYCGYHLETPYKVSKIADQ